jgi:hypothetical protein
VIRNSTRERWKQPRWLKQLSSSIALYCFESVPHARVTEGRQDLPRQFFPWIFGRGSQSMSKFLPGGRASTKRETLNPDLLCKAGKEFTKEMLKPGHPFLFYSFRFSSASSHCSDSVFFTQQWPHMSKCIYNCKTVFLSYFELRPEIFSHFSCPTTFHILIVYTRGIQPLLLAYPHMLFFSFVPQSCWCTCIIQAQVSCG